MGFKEELQSAVDEVVKSSLDVIDGRAMPDEKNIPLGSGATRVPVAILYADLAASTAMVKNLKPEVAAVVIRAFLKCAARCITYRGGAIKSFDGDRVMGVFYGGSKELDAARCALDIAFAVSNIVRPALRKRWQTIEQYYKLDHAAGVDTSNVLVVRGGPRGDNDLVWVGSAPNVAARLSEVRHATYKSFITNAVFGALGKDLKKDNKGNPVWYKHSDRRFPSLGDFCASSYFTSF